MRPASGFKRQRAIVVGGSLAGLFAAAGVAPLFEQVVVLERAAVDDAAVGSCVPQAPHVHGLLSSGLRALEALLPGVQAELSAQGAEQIRPLSDMVYIDQMGPWSRIDAGPCVMALPRSQLEAHVRGRVRALSNVVLRAGSRVEDVTPADGEVTAHLGGQSPLRGAIVIDATGHGRLLRRCFERLNGSRVPERRCELAVGYSSVWFDQLRLPGDARGMVISDGTPERARGGVVLSQGDGRFVLSLVGQQGQFPPGDLAGLRAFAQTLVDPSLARLLEQHSPLGPVHRFAIQGSVRRHFERTRHAPSRVYGIGDAVCRFNPVHGQGITVAALQALNLREVLSEPQANLERQYWRRLSRLLEAPWALSSSPDWLLTNDSEDKPWWVPLGARVSETVLRAAYVDPSVRSLLADVLHLNRPPRQLLSPSVIPRVLQAARRYSAQRGSVGG